MVRKEVEIKSPITGGKVIEVFDKEEQVFRNEHFLVDVRYYVCIDTGEKFTTTEQDELLFGQLYSQYRQKHGIPSPEEIKGIRLAYGLNISQITKILGFGSNQYSLYEGGQMPSESNGKLIRAIFSKQAMIDLTKASRDSFSDEEYEQVLDSVLESQLDTKSVGNVAQTEGHASQKMQTVGNVIRDAAKRKGVSQRQLAASLGISHSRINDFVCGRAVPSLSMAARLCSILGIPPAVMLQI